MIKIKIFDFAGSFAENKDIAQLIRKKEIIPALDNKKDVEIDFLGVESATQSFIHALISDLIRNYGTEVLDRISFKNCNDILKKIIEIVVEYMQES